MTEGKTPDASESGASPRETDAVWSRKEPDSPCVKICVIQPATGLCAGCGRTIDEISRWGGMSGEERARVSAQLPARMAQKTPREMRPSARRRQRGGESPDGSDR